MFNCQPQPLELHRFLFAMEQETGDHPLPGWTYDQQMDKKVYNRFLDGLMKKPENKVLYDDWMGAPSDSYRDKKLELYEQFFQQGNTKGFWHRWRDEVKGRSGCVRSRSGSRAHH